ncbi:MAG: coenzyme F420 hydrogenase, partial [Anaerolineae bacterium]|nr:coenzyme F420 hydrogenase [Anaerolineae bacterium]
MVTPDFFAQLERDVIRPGLCTYCGLCVGLSNGTLTMTDTSCGLLPTCTDAPPQLPALAYEACPGRRIDYPALNEAIFGAAPENWLTGHVRQMFIGYATDEAIRRRAASGGIITRTLIYLLEQGRIDGAVVVRQGQPQPWQA